MKGPLQEKPNRHPGSEMAMGHFFSTRPDPTHGFFDPARPTGKFHDPTRPVTRAYTHSIYTYVHTEFLFLKVLIVNCEPPIYIVQNL